LNRLSIVIPAYNEERFIGTLLERIRAVDLTPLGFEKEVIVVDDCSKDATSEAVRRFSDVLLIRHEQNGGKGQAVRTGVERATGDYVMIQDADLEYEPQDYIPMIQMLRSGSADIVYGSRYMNGLVGSKHAEQSWAAYLGGRSLSGLRGRIRGLSRRRSRRADGLSLRLVLRMGKGRMIRKKHHKIAGCANADGGHGDLAMNPLVVIEGRIKCIDLALEMKAHFFSLCKVLK